MTNRLLLPRSQAVGLDGRPLAGAKLYTYITGTATPKAVFTDAGLTIPHANPVIADAAGRFPAMFLAVGDYRTVLTDAADVTIATDDPVEGQVEPTVPPWTDVASAASMDLGFVNSENLRITGTTTITALGTAASGTRRQLRFAGALTLTHNATSLILPGGANISAAAGDTAVAVSLGGGNWVVVDYEYATAAAARVAIGAPATPTGPAGVGQWVAILPGTGNAAVLPAGGTWSYFSFRTFDSTGALDGNHATGAGAAGGTTVGAGFAGRSWVGFCWRIA